MRTDDLVRALANGAGAADAGVAPRRYATALTLGAIGALAVVAVKLGFNPALAALAAHPMFWVREAFVLGVAVAGFVALARLARPGVPLGRAAWAPAAPVITMWALAAAVLLVASPDARAALVMGSTWRVCPLNITLVSLPVLAAALWAARGMAPTRPALAGAAAGVLAGGVGALAYTLHCPEIEAPFLGVWYVLGMAAPVLIGAAIGPKLLRW